MRDVSASPPTFGDAPTAEFGDWDAEQVRRAQLERPTPGMEHRSVVTFWVAALALVAVTVTVAVAAYYVLASL